MADQASRAPELLIQMGYPVTPGKATWPPSPPGTYALLKCHRDAKTFLG
jgi:hypothetical protein